MQRRETDRVCHADAVGGALFWPATVLLAGLVLAGPGWAQPSVQTSPVPGVQGPAQGTAPQQQVPEVIHPNSGQAGASGQSTQTVPRNGVITPPPTAGSGASVIKPPATGSMPVIAPPGSAGGTTSAVPK